MVNHSWYCNGAKLKFIPSKFSQCLKYTNKILNLGHLVIVFWLKYYKIKNLIKTFSNFTMHATYLAKQI
jgi:hypothetical protein